jgi:hypothetical protein
MTELDKHRHEADLQGTFSRDIYSKVVRAGRRTYFFDVKSTRKEEMYLIITERKKHIETNGNISYEKHKIFIYREDFRNFIDTLNEMCDFICTNEKKEPEASEVGEDADEIG